MFGVDVEGRTWFLFKRVCFFCWNALHPEQEQCYETGFLSNLSSPFRLLSFCPYWKKSHRLHQTDERFFFFFPPIKYLKWNPFLVLFFAATAEVQETSRRRCVCTWLVWWIVFPQWRFQRLTELKNRMVIKLFWRAVSFWHACPRFRDRDKPRLMTVAA